MAMLSSRSQPTWIHSLRTHPQDFQNVMSLKYNPPRVVFDNDFDAHATIVTVDSATRHGCLLEVVQLLTDLGLVITKAQVSSDGVWFVDVFHVTDKQGMKVVDPKLVSYVQQKLGAAKPSTPPVDAPSNKARHPLALDMARSNHIGIELSGTDRPGLLHDLAKDIASMGCSVLAAEVWTHNKRVAFVIYVTESTGAAIKDPAVVQSLTARLKRTMAGSSDAVPHLPLASVCDGRTHSGRRMHQIMFEYDGMAPGLECKPISSVADSNSLSNCEEEPQEVEMEEDVVLKPRVSVRNSRELGYSIVNVRALDRAKLLFDTVCTLTDMQYAIHHANVESEDGVATQEYFVRGFDGRLLESEAERARLVKCLRAAIQRHTPLGTCLQLSASDRVGLLADVTGIFKSKGMSIAAATVSTEGGEALNEFFVVAEDGQPVDRHTLETIQHQVGPTILAIKDTPTPVPASPPRDEVAGPFSFTNLLRIQSEKLMATLGFAPPSTSLP